MRPRCCDSDDEDSGMLLKKYGMAMYLMLATPVASIAVTAPYALQPRGGVDEGVRGVKTGEERKIK